MDRAGAFFAAIARAPSERSVAIALMDAAGSLTGGYAVGFQLVRSPTEPSELHSRGVAASLLDDYEAWGRALDPLLRWVCEHHTAVENDKETLERTAPEYRHVIGEFEAKHAGTRQYMLAPILVGNAIAGMMHFASCAHARFDARLGAAISLHVSTRIAVLRALDSFSATWEGVLTRREREVAELAARGLSTRDVARTIGVSPNTVKKHLKALYVRMGVSSRAELSMLLLRGPAALEARQPVLPAPRRLHAGTQLYVY